MKRSELKMRIRTLFVVILGLLLLVQLRGEPVQAAPAPAASISLNMSNPVCVQALPASGTCSIQFASLYASGSDTSFSRVEVLVNGKLRAIVTGFFESSASLTYGMLPGGLKVKCGRPNASGRPDYGLSYSLVANAYMIDGTSAFNSSTIFCPAYDGKTYVPLIRK